MSWPRPRLGPAALPAVGPPGSARGKTPPPRLPGFFPKGPPLSSIWQKDLKHNSLGLYNHNEINLMCRLKHIYVISKHFPYINTCWFKPNDTHENMYYIHKVYIKSNTQIVSNSMITTKIHNTYNVYIYIYTIYIYIQHMKYLQHLQFVQCMQCMHCEQ